MDRDFQVCCEAAVMPCIKLAAPTQAQVVSEDRTLWFTQTLLPPWKRADLAVCS